MEYRELVAKYDESCGEVVACRTDWRNASPEGKRAAEERVRAAMQTAHWWFRQLCEAR